ncbi:MAG: ribose-phosphate pyrophosphokinase [Candidatus Aenigmarchaeota archaeon]|nr:ribose-phosphate pyrophosphokinase [Candidatus Aenigmarchaeota archaeon]
MVKLLLVPCSGGETSDLTRGILNALKHDHNLGEDVEILGSSRSITIEKGTPKDNRYPLVVDYFDDGEVRADIGKNELIDTIRGRHVVLIEHLLTPDREMFSDFIGQKVSVNDHVATVKGVLNLLSNTDALGRILVAPYLTYVRSHSVEKYREQEFFQFDSLNMFLKEFQNSKLDTLVTLDPHSDKAKQIAEEFGMYYHAANPFQSTRSLNPYKLGIADEKIDSVMNNLRPFHKRFEEMKKEYGNRLYLVSVDDGTEGRVENFVDRCFAELQPKEYYARVMYFDKRRVALDKSEYKVKPFSKINRKNVDKEGIYIIIDDMYASGGTACDVGEILKKAGANRVEVWTSHVVTTPRQYEKSNNRPYIDALVCIDTVPRNDGLKVEYIPASTALLASEIYKAHQKLVNERLRRFR